MPHRLSLVDVFAETPFSGNPLAVVHEADGLSSEAMQRIARWHNLSETAFLLRPTIEGADYRVRIFTLSRELPFAGHPTLGSCQAWLDAGGLPQQNDEIVQECGVGLVRIRPSADGRLAFAAPPLRRAGPVEETTVQAAARQLGLAREQISAAQWADNGPGWLAVVLPSVEQLLAISPQRNPATPLKVGAIAFYDSGAAAYAVRTFFPDQQGTIFEDPVTGSFNAAAAQWLLQRGQVSAPYAVRQGQALGRDGWLFIDQSADGTVWVGGRALSLVAGETAW